MARADEAMPSIVEEVRGAAPGQKTDKLVRPVRAVPSANEPLAEVGE